MAPRLSALILAAGFSSRMGELKALLPLGQRTVLEQCLALFQDCGIEDLVVVTGHRADEVGAIAEQAGARVAHNPDFASGMYSSIRAGVRRIAEGSSGFFLLPVDIPLVRRGTIRLQHQSFTERKSQILYPVFADRRGHPPLLAAHLIPIINGEHQPEGGLRTLLAQIEAEQPEQVREIQVADSNIHFDMDTREDYISGCLRLNRCDIPTMAECEVILEHLHPMPEKGWAHGRMVAEVAVALCEAIIRQSGRELDPELCRVCGWLHDIAKGHPRHEEEGARWLRALGFDRAADIIAAHRDVDWTPAMAISEREIVHLADKLVRGSRIVGIGERFEEKLTLYQNDPEAVRAIRGRYDQALRVAAAVETEAGQPLEVITEMAVAGCKP
jgi:putative nucleotidyltransferase with HDIG domain